MNPSNVKARLSACLASPLPPPGVPVVLQSAAGEPIATSTRLGPVGARRDAT